MDNLKNKSSQLSNMTKENPFRVPDSYFDDFSARLQYKIEAERNIIPSRPNRFIRVLKPALGLAASFALIALLVYGPIKVFNPKSQSADNRTEESNLSYMEYINTLIEEGNDFSYYAQSEEQSNELEISGEDIANYVPTHTSAFELYAETYNNK